jgi:diamine N-acetyltransferase
MSAAGISGRPLRIRGNGEHPDATSEQRRKSAFGSTRFVIVALCRPFSTLLAAGSNLYAHRVGVRLEEISDGNRAAVLALRVAPGQEQFVSSVPESLAEAAEFPHARPWYRAVVADGIPVGFVMVSWNAEPDPPEIIGPWFLWKLLIDERYQRRGYGAEVVRQIAELVRAEGAAELLTSYVPEPGGPARFYERLGFVPTGDVDGDGEVIMRLALP